MIRIGTCWRDGSALREGPGVGVKRILWGIHRHFAASSSVVPNLTDMVGSNIFIQNCRNSVSSPENDLGSCSHCMVEVEFGV